MEQRIAGLGRIGAADAQLPDISSAHPSFPFQAAAFPRTAATQGVVNAMTDEERMATSFDRSIKYSHADTAAYEWGGGVPTPFDDWRDWQGIFRSGPIRPEWYYNVTTPPGIALQTAGRAHAPTAVSPGPARYAQYRNVPYFAAEQIMPTDPPRIPTWPHRTAPFVAGGVAPIFRIIGDAKPQQQAPMWPHLPAGQSGDVPVIVGRYLRALQWEMPSGVYPVSRKAYFPRQYQSNPHQVTSQAMYYTRGARPGLLEPSRPRQETILPSGAGGIGAFSGGRHRQRRWASKAVRQTAIGNYRGCGVGAVGTGAADEVVEMKVPWTAIVLALSAIPGALLAWYQYKTIVAKK